MNKLKKIADRLFNLTVKEAKELEIILEEEYDIKPHQSTVVIVGDNKDFVSEKTNFDVVLTNVPWDRRLKVLKLIKDLTNLNLMESKKLVSELPSTLFQDLPKEEAESIVKQLIDADCDARIV